MSHNLHLFACSSQFNSWTQVMIYLLLLATKNGACTLIWNNERNGLTLINKWHCVNQDLHLHKTMLYIWWDWEGIIHYELLEWNKTVNVKLHDQQMKWLNLAIQEKGPNWLHRVFSLHDNIYHHIANMIKKAIQMYGWEMLPHMTYSPKFGTNRFPPLSISSNTMHRNSFNTDANLRAWLDEFL